MAGFVPFKIIILALCLFLLFAVFMMGLLSSEDSEVKAYEKFLKESELKRQRRESKRQHTRNDAPESPVSGHEKPADWDVQFISGKEMVKVVEGEHKQIQVHDVTLENLEDIDALVQCRDPFSKFSEIIPVGGKYEFSVTDIFHKRHYWCTVHFGKFTYNFKAYGEGAPRDNNHIMLKRKGAFINGEDMTSHDTTDPTNGRTFKKPE